MSSLGEWDDAVPVYDLADAPVADVDEEPDEPIGRVSEEVVATVRQLDVGAIAGGLVAATVTAEIHRQVQRTVAPIVEVAVEEVLTPARLDQLREAAQAAAEAELSPAEDEASAEESPALYYGSVDEFVREFLSPIFSRNIGERAEARWSARWWESAEAVVRLEAVWRAWEHLRLDPATGTSVWLRDHLDHHLGVLMSPTGPFARSQDSAKPGEPLPYEPPPEGLFPDLR